MTTPDSPIRNDSSSNQTTSPTLTPTTPGQVASLAASITQAASAQTYYTIRFLVDRPRVADAYRAYAYFRWVDDHLDTGAGSGSERSAFVQRQKLLLEDCYRGQPPQDANIQENMLVELIRRNPEKNNGLHFYLRNMMRVMAFDVERQGKLVSQAELNEYTRWLAGAVTESMHYFIGRDDFSPHGEMRYLAVAAAHITHMLRDTFDDLQAGYYNIPREALEANHISPQDVHSDAYRAWVRSRVQLAHAYFKAGRDYLNRVENARCRLAGYAYTARFEGLLDVIEREDYCLRPAYPERKSFGAGLRMSWLALSALIHLSPQGVSPQPLGVGLQPPPQRKL